MVSTRKIDGDARAGAERECDEALTLASHDRLQQRKDVATTGSVQASPLPHSLRWRDSKTISQRWTIRRFTMRLSR
jgi:hypothetical protein